MLKGEDGNVWTIQRGGLPNEPKDEDYSCEKCHEVFLNSGSLHRHLLRGSNEEVPTHFYCGRCQIDFGDKDELKAHIVTGFEHHWCKQCNREYQTPEEYALHRKQSHPPQEEHNCPGCDEPFSAIHRVVQHIEGGYCSGNITADHFQALRNTTTTHAWRACLPGRTKETPAQTGESSKTGAKVAKPVQKRHTTVIDYNLKAPEPIVFDEANRFKYWNEMVQSYVCPVRGCGKKFDRTNGLKMHMESNAHNPKVFRCPKCFTCFGTASAILQHAQSEACPVKQSPDLYAELIKLSTGGLMEAPKPTYRTGW
ncbi:hypothetical protein L873DRAFT_1712094 [Choiromyces venosus 120613-1]|uniref:C2H2-type domain-containing protein n=1 Tax=Choiromyces venosus 120613-1 TaxID=1336337 RepID=A0A3N4J157_9PEZI|nr:hypothetical protein L873DRAFT_1712094 [Choiromyces venosus 120613-1]